MYADVTLKAKDFETIHNALWQLQYGHAINVDNVVEQIRAALQDCYQQDEAVFHARGEHFKEVRDSLGLTTIWSMYEVEDMSERHPYQGIRTLTYKNHWGEGGDVVVPVNGLTWAALYVAANAAIRESGDLHHVYIEDFQQVDDTLILVTGS